jgi:hypothetical protein
MSRWRRHPLHILVAQRGVLLPAGLGSAEAIPPLLGFTAARPTFLDVLCVLAPLSVVQFSLARAVAVGATGASDSGKVATPTTPALTLLITDCKAVLLQPDKVRADAARVRLAFRHPAEDHRDLGGGAQILHIEGVQYESTCRAKSAAPERIMSRETVKGTVLLTP